MTPGAANDQNAETESPIQRFRTLDTDKSGDISFSEIVAWYEIDTKVDVEVLKLRFKETDKNNNGILEPGEVDSTLADSEVNKR
jgi:Ca2+-binding EF-hand superfamily protein